MPGLQPGIPATRESEGEDEVSPTEEATITRFGMFDTEIITDLENHFHDILPCDEDDCTAESTHLVQIRCCRNPATFCTDHYTTARSSMALRLARMGLNGIHPTCAKCGHRFPVWSLFEDIYGVVNL